MNGLKGIAKYIRRIEGVKGRLPTHIQSLAGRARAAIGGPPARLLLPHRHSESAGEGYQPTPFLAHPFFQAVYNISEPKLKLEYNR